MAGYIFGTQRKAIVLMNLIVVAVVVVWVFNQKESFVFLPHKYVGLPGNTSQRIGKAATLPSNPAVKPPPAATCQYTNVDAFDPKIVKLAKKYPPINCTAGQPWIVYLDGSSLKVNLTKVNEHPGTKNFSHCRYRTLTKSSKNDQSCVYGTWSKHFGKSITISDDSVWIETECYNKSKLSISNSYLMNMKLHHKNEDTSHISRYVNHLKRFAPKETLNVLLVGIDGMSKQNYKRSLPRTRDFILRNMSGIEFEKYNKVGLNTFPNILPMLTGHNQNFFRKAHNWSAKTPFDKIGDYFIWKEFSKAGYRTLLDLEETHITAFHYLKKGFYQTPVDYYTRPIVVATTKKKIMRASGKLCLGDKPAVSMHNGFLLELATQFNNPSSPYFGFSFLTRLTHDDQNRASSGDNLYVDFLQTLKDRELLNNTILFMFSDHGERFGSIRRTYNGVIESKSPACFIILPDWFKSKYPEEVKRLQVNADRLISVYDIHATLRDIIYFKSNSPPDNMFPKPGVSLFRELLPQTRTCPDAGIPVEYCNCNSLKKVELDKETSKNISLAVTNSLMKSLGTLVKSKCHELKPKSVTSLLEKDPPKDRKKDIFSADSVLYQITMVTTPGNGVFEAVVEYNNKTKTYKAVGSISRLDMYKGEKDCISDPNIRPFCFCK